MRDTKTRNVIKVVLHIFAWTIITLLPFLIVKQWNVGIKFLKFYHVTNIVSALIFYINYLFLFPRFYLKRHLKKYFVSVILVIFMFYYLSGFASMAVFRSINNTNTPAIADSDFRELFRFRLWDFNMPRSVKQMQIYNYVITATALIFLSGGLRALERQSGVERMQKDLEKEKLNSELAFLKNQISPHFLFNTLNNIYSLIEVNAEDSRDAILKLARLMRYLLYESQGDTMLSKEIDFMSDYIDLMKLRMVEKIRLSVDFPDKYEDLTIPPLLFIPFIENAFKHGISYRGKSFIEVKLEARDSELNFTCTNSKTARSILDKKQGIGLDNVKKRLQLLFPGKHGLNINETDMDYNVNLKIMLA
ncbi:MAG TPA: histidine kinase [Bacteroidales bacterium]|nr:histidine kinase [Bacteroidales bacterium]